MRIAIVGAGLAGPLLAVALRRAGWEVGLFERDPAAASRGQGYRIHIAPEGVAALRQCLPPDLYALAVALRDAALLARRLLEAGGDPVPAIHAYEAEMLVYGFAAVAASQRPLGG